MSAFNVTVETIERTWPIQFTKDGNLQVAGNIELAKLIGKEYQFVVKKGEFQAGMLCLYFPVDSVLPDELVKKLGLWDVEKDKSRLSKNRVRTVKLCQALSQGLVASVDLLPKDGAFGDIVLLMANAISRQTLSDTITTYLGVTKYEPPVVPCKTGLLRPLPMGLSKYDIESCQNYPAIMETLMNHEVVITEKLEGQNFSVSYHHDSSWVYVNQRNFTIEEIDGSEHSFWKVARELKLTEAVRQIGENAKADVTIYGEYLGPGVQGNLYKLDSHTVKLYDVRVGGRFLDFDALNAILTPMAGIVGAVPVIFRGVLKDWLGGRSVVEMASGSSALLSSQLREGIVIKPVVEQSCEIGRVILKVRDPVYLERTGN